MLMDTIKIQLEFDFDGIQINFDSIQINTAEKLDSKRIQLLLGLKLILKLGLNSNGLVINKNILAMFKMLRYQAINPLAYS